MRLIAIIHTIDGDNCLTSCMLSLNQCDVDHPCPIHDLIGDAKTNFVKNLQSTTVQHLVSDIQEGKSFLPF